MSVNKRYCTAFGIHPVPAGTTLAEFQAKCEALVQSFLVLPAAQANFLKFDMVLIFLVRPHRQRRLTRRSSPKMITSRGICRSWGFPQRSRSSASDATMRPNPTGPLLQCLQDPDIINAMALGKSWGFHEGASIFSCDSVKQLDSGVPADTNVLLAIARLPQIQAATTVFSQDFESTLTKVLNMKKPIMNVTTLIGTLDAEKDLIAAGCPASQPIIVVVAECQTLNAISEISNDTNVKTVVATALKGFASQITANVFSAEVKNFLRVGSPQESRRFIEYCKSLAPRLHPTFNAAFNYPVWAIHQFSVKSGPVGQCSRKRTRAGSKKGVAR
ncbi:hypothetical protein FB45DRAFT_1081365 [Roridomyces roridus]|uniref:Uncharacterized protein n=1 Tax=Roridomyces roridus TaxID=1738132 RepID=A0AAD7AYI2_9AGAR|nr:hypothetical protein FB45DRAFT_1081365 [Roridomyces roridus]